MVLDRSAILHLQGRGDHRAPAGPPHVRTGGHLGGPALARIVGDPTVLDPSITASASGFDRVLVSGLGPMAAAAGLASCLELELALVPSTVAAYDELAAAVGELVPESALASYLRWLLAPASAILVVDDDARALVERIGIPAHRTRLVELASTLQPLAASTAV